MPLESCTDFEQVAWKDGPKQVALIVIDRMIANRNVREVVIMRWDREEDGRLDQELVAFRPEWI